MNRMGTYRSSNDVGLIFDFVAVNDIISSNTTDMHKQIANDPKINVTINIRANVNFGD